mmetsp:Transcript_66059/g.157974  ORF Transcript_66059/g.157974 Transcript_66059/m.157974 type:complete len:730 (-) Transcript_66059:115-2304(-)
MGWLAFAGVLCALAGCVAGGVVEEPVLSLGWQSVISGSDGAVDRVRFVIQVQEQNLPELYRIAHAVSNPKSERYGQFLTQDQIDDLTQPRVEDVEAVRRFLESDADLVITEVHKDRTFVVDGPASSVGTLLQTNIRRLFNAETGQTAIRASDYFLPEHVEAAVGAVFGLHGLPLPPKVAAPPPAASVTPEVIASQYKVSGVSVSRSAKNTQAVAEFQGQTMNHTDLKVFFDKYIKDFQPGDEQVSKFVGDPGDRRAQVEASLDVQYIMGVAPGIKTEFWLFDPMDFCADLKNWTTQLLQDPNCPLVHSVSYGWQGDLDTIGCQKANVDVVDADFAKLAAKGISVIFASGDSGSGYSSTTTCNSPSAYEHGVELTGPLTHTYHVPSSSTCCILAAPASFTFEPAKTTCEAQSVKGMSLSGVEKETRVKYPKSSCCVTAANIKAEGWSWLPEASGGGYLGTCIIYSHVTGSGQNTSVEIESEMHPQTVSGTCKVFQAVTGKKSNPSAVSLASSQGQVQLWPSWPASSPWVTAVGATRFVGSEASGEEMASYSFGSGGGFSKQFNQDKAEWQKEVVKTYLEEVPKGLPFPPEGSFPKDGRATPDVSSLGEGFQVVDQGKIISVGGTSASAPLFAGLVSLLNEARLNAGKPPMGFLNPFLYQHGVPDESNYVFTDVTKGTNAIGRGTGPAKYGFNCSKGWDPATGVGTPRFDKILEAAMAAVEEQGYAQMLVV